MPEAQEILNRSKEWVKTRMVAFVIHPMNADWILMENSYIFNKASIDRLKSEMIRMGAAETSEF